MASAVAAAGRATIKVPATTAAQRRAALAHYIAKLPKSVSKLFSESPLRGHSISSLLSPDASTGVRAGTYSLPSAFESAALTKSEDKLAGHLRTFALIVATLKPGQLPAGL